MTKKTPSRDKTVNSLNLQFMSTLVCFWCALECFRGFFTELLERLEDSHKFSFIFISFFWCADKLLMGWEILLVCDVFIGSSISLLFFFSNNLEFKYLG